MGDQGCHGSGMAREPRYPPRRAAFDGPSIRRSLTPKHQQAGAQLFPEQITQIRPTGVVMQLQPKLTIGRNRAPPGA